MNETAFPPDKLGAWAIIELFGHTRIAGYVSEYVIGRRALIRVDVPDVPNVPAFTRLYGTSAIYSISFVDEDTARRAVYAIHHHQLAVLGEQLVVAGDLQVVVDRMAEIERMLEATRIPELVADLAEMGFTVTLAITPTPKAAAEIVADLGGGWQIVRTPTPVDGH
jgi:hypothetical protein